MRIGGSDVRGNQDPAPLNAGKGLEKDDNVAREQLRAGSNLREPRNPSKISEHF